MEIYNRLLKVNPDESNITVSMNIESFKGLSIEQIVSAKYKDNKGNYLGKDEISKFVFNLLLYIYLRNNINDKMIDSFRKSDL